MKLLLLVLLILTTTINVRPQQSSFTVASIRPYDKAVPGQVMEVLIEGLGSGAGPMVIPETDFKVEVLQDGIVQKAKVRITKFTMIREANPERSNKNAVDFAGMKMRSYQAVSFVVPKGLHPGPSEVVVSYKGKRGNAIGMEIIEKPLTPVVGTSSVLAAGGMAPERTSEVKLEENDFGWRLERGTTARLYINPLVDPDDPNSAILIRFKQNGNNYDAVTRVMTSPSRVENRSRGPAFHAAREDLEVDVPAALTAGKAQVEIRLKASGQIGDAVTLTALITDVTRSAETPAVSAPRVLAATPNRIGAGQALLISIDHRRTLEPSPKETQVIVEQENVRYFATIEQNSAVLNPGTQQDEPVALFARTTQQLIGRVQIRILNPLRGEQTGLSAPVAVDIVDEVLPPELISVGESTDADLARLREMYETQKRAGKEFPAYDPNSHYLTIRARGVDYNPTFVRITLEQADRKFTLETDDLSSYSGDALVVRVPKDLTGGNVKLTIENFGGERYSAPVSKQFVLSTR